MCLKFTPVADEMDLEKETDRVKYLLTAVKKHGTCICIVFLPEIL